MDTVFKLNGTDYLRWCKNELFYEAPKEAVELLGKEFFENYTVLYLEEQDACAASGITFQNTDALSYQLDYFKMYLNELYSELYTD